jgi:hypothetical protein
MDTGLGRFRKVKEIADIDQLRGKYPKSRGIFTVGEELKIKGSWFQVKKITPFGINLKLLKAK